MVDNVDKPLWITHADFVNNHGIRAILTHGKPCFSGFILQDFLPEKYAGLRCFSCGWPVKRMDASYWFRYKKPVFLRIFWKVPLPLWRKFARLGIL